MDERRFSKLKEQALKNIDTINKLIRDLKCGQLLVKPKFLTKPEPPETKEDFFTMKEVD